MSRILHSAAILVLASSLVGSSANAGAPSYRTLNETPFGKAFVTERHDAKSVKSALQLTRQDVARYFGAAPSTFRAYEDSKDPHLGGATFLVTSRGVDMKGLVKCEVTGRAAKVAVAFIRADAPPTEWSRLVQAQPAEPLAPASPPAAANAPASSGETKIPAPAHVSLRTYTFPDGTGSVGLAEGWTTAAQTCMQAVTLKGPSGQIAVMGNIFSGSTPRSTLPRGPNALMAPFATPVEMLQTVVPQLSQLSVRQGGPARTLDHLVKVSDVKATLPKGQQSLLRFGVTEAQRDGSRKHFQVLAQVEVDPVTQTSWMMSVTQVGALDATFADDLPVMLQMIGSLKSNEALIRQRGGQQLAAQNQRFQAQQAAHRAQQASADAHNQQYWANQKATDQRNRSAEAAQTDQARRNDNFDEVIRGQRTVEDTQTGVKTSVNLGNVDKIVDDLNERDPGRYRQIPLRDENNPLSGR